MIQGPRRPDQEPAAGSDRVEVRRRAQLIALVVGGISARLSSVAIGLVALDAQFFGDDTIQRLAETADQFPLGLGVIVDQLQRVGLSDQTIINVLYGLAVGLFGISRTFERPIRNLRRP